MTTQNKTKNYMKNEMNKVPFEQIGETLYASLKDYYSNIGTKAGDEAFLKICILCQRIGVRRQFAIASIVHNVQADGRPSFRSLEAWKRTWGYMVVTLDKEMQISQAKVNNAVQKYTEKHKKEQPKQKSESIYYSTLGKRKWWLTPHKIEKYDTGCMVDTTYQLKQDSLEEVLDRGHLNRINRANLNFTDPDGDYYINLETADETIEAKERRAEDFDMRFRETWFVCDQGKPTELWWNDRPDADGNYLAWVKYQEYKSNPFWNCQEVVKGYYDKKHKLILVKISQQCRTYIMDDMRAWHKWLKSKKSTK